LEHVKDRFKASYLPVTFRTPVNFIGLFSGRHRRLATQSSCGEANVFGTIKFFNAEQATGLSFRTTASSNIGPVSSRNRMRNKKGNLSE
jgi:hypothetical protein